MNQIKCTLCGVWRRPSEFKRRKERVHQPCKPCKEAGKWRFKPGRPGMKGKKGHPPAHLTLVDYQPEPMT